jgi:hypothetical protein
MDGTVLVVHGWRTDWTNGIIRFVSRAEPGLTLTLIYLHNRSGCALECPSAQQLADALILI